MGSHSVMPSTTPRKKDFSSSTINMAKFAFQRMSFSLCLLQTH